MAFRLKSVQNLRRPMVLAPKSLDDLLRSAFFTPSQRERVLAPPQSLVTGQCRTQASVTETALDFPPTQFRK